jgi:hypothetical protein
MSDRIALVTSGSFRIPIVIETTDQSATYCHWHNIFLCSFDESILYLLGGQMLNSICVPDIAYWDIRSGDRYCSFYVGSVVEAYKHRHTQSFRWGHYVQALINAYGYELSTGFRQRVILCVENIHRHVDPVRIEKLVSFTIIRSSRCIPSFLIELGCQI